MTILSAISTNLSPFQVDELTAERDADAARFEADLAALRGQVAALLQRMFDGEVAEAAAVEALRELGCEVQFVASAVEVPGDPAAYAFEPRLLLDDPAKMARLMQAARSQSGGSSPRLLEAPSTSSGGSLTPRINQGGSIMHAALPVPSLTIGHCTSGGSGSGTPRFVLSWLGGGSGGAAGVSGRDVAAAEAVVEDAVRGRRADTPKDAAAIAPAAVARSPTKPTGAAASGKANMQVEQQSGTLVFSPQSKVRF
jgi:hypothetical protein